MRIAMRLRAFMHVLHAIPRTPIYCRPIRLIPLPVGDRAGCAAFAAHSIHRWMYPDKELHFEYSTTKGVPGTA